MHSKRFVLPVFLLSFSIGGMLGYTFSPFRTLLLPKEDCTKLTLEIKREKAMQSFTKRKTPPPKKRASFDCKTSTQGTQIQLNFEKASILDIVELMSAYTCKNFIIPDYIKSGKFSLISVVPVSIQDALSTFELLLETQNLVLIENGPFFLIEEKGRPAYRNRFPSK